MQSYVADIGHILYVDIGHTLYVLRCLSKSYEKCKTSFFKKERKGERAEKGAEREWFSDPSVLISNLTLVWFFDTSAIPILLLPCSSL